MLNVWLWYYEYIFKMSILQANLGFRKSRLPPDLILYINQTTFYDIVMQMYK